MKPRTFTLYATACAVAFALFTTMLARGEDAPKQAQSKSAETEAAADAPKIEVVFVLDTTGSMSGMIQAAKEKIWAIANSMASAKPAPQIKMGLVGYRDRTDQYITKHAELTDDLDAIYAELMGFQAQGGGDTPESVNQALNEAVVRFPWSKDEETFRVIFLVGDCPPHMDYQDDVKYPKSCELACRAGIIVNTIQCGTHAATTPIWKEIAKLGEGEYFQVAQDGGGAVVPDTPYDEELSKLSRELDGTRIYYGRGIQSQSERAEKASSIYRFAESKAVAQRAAYNASFAGKSNFLGDNELVDEVHTGQKKLADIDKDELPEDLQKLEPEELKALIDKKAAQRETLQAQIKALSAKRQAYIKRELEKNNTAKDSFDVKLWESLRGQAAETKGIELDGDIQF